MWTTIHKYQVPIVDEFSLQLPKGSKILTFQYQNDDFFIWVYKDTTTSFETRSFRLFGTGRPISDNTLDNTLKYIGTAVGKVYVWHLFEIKTTIKSGITFE